VTGFIEHTGKFMSWRFGAKDNLGTMPQRPGRRIMDGGVQANEELYRGLYHGTAKGWQFASPLCYIPINVLTIMMGYPTPVADEGPQKDATQAALNYIMSELSTRVVSTHRGSLITGNAWRWPVFNSRLADSQGNLGAIGLDALPDAVVCDVLLDVQSGRTVSVLTDEYIRLKTGENKFLDTERKRRYDHDRVSTRWYGQRPAGVEDGVMLNVAEMLPENFATDADEGEIRGHGKFERPLRVLKDYHDLAFRKAETLSRFKVKQVQTVADPSTWRKENGLETDQAFAEFDAASADLILNRMNETTKYEFLSADATAAIEKAMETDFYLIVEATGMPELFWGPLATGNHASTDSDILLATEFAKSTQDEFGPHWFNILQGALRLMSIARGDRYGSFRVKWNKFSMVSPEVKSKILLAWAQAASTFINSGSCTKQQLYAMWCDLYSEYAAGTFEEFSAGMDDMGAFKQFLGEQFGAGMEDRLAGSGGAK
jgi:hypothetical protein